MSVDLEAARWRTDLDVDPRLVNSFTTGQVHSVAALWHDGRLLIAAVISAHDDCGADEAHDCSGPAVRVWVAGSGDLLRTIPDVGGEDRAVTLAVVDGRPQVLMAHWTGPVRRWDLETGESAEVAQPVQPVVDLLVEELDDTPTLLLRGFRGTVEWWDLARAMPGREPPAEFLGYPHSLARLGGDPVTVTGEDGGRVEVRDVRTGEVRCAATVSAPRPYGLTIAGPFLVVASSGQVELVDLATGQPAPPLTGRTACARLAAVVVAGRPYLVTASADAGEVRVWDLTVAPPPHRTARHTDRIRAVALAGEGDERMVVTGADDGTVRRWRATDGQPVAAPLTGHPGPVRAIACTSVDGVPVAVTGGGDLNETRDSTLRRWNLRTGQEWGPPIDTDDRGETTHLATAMVDGRAAVLSSGCNGRVALWDVATGARLGDQAEKYPPDGMVTGPVRGRPTAVITRALFDPLRAWDLTDRVLLPTPERNWRYDKVRGLVTVRGVATLVTVDGDRQLRLWRLEDAEPPTPVAMPSLVDVVDVAEVGGRAIAAVGCDDKVVRVVDLVDGNVVAAVVLPAWASALALGDGGELVVCHGVDVALFDVAALIGNRNPRNALA